MCEHLLELESELQRKGIRETHRGRPWSRNCREWAYFDCYLDSSAIRNRLKLSDCVEEHVNDDNKSGVERGLVCSEHHDGIIGLHQPQAGKPIVQ